MNDIISIIILLAVYLIGLIFIVLIFNDFLTDNNFSHHVPRVRELITWYEKYAPFTDLPEDIKQQLQNIINLPDASESEVQLLASSLHDIYNSRQKKEKKARKINYVLGAVSIASFCITLFQACSNKFIPS